jgi:hypothetical protein
MTFVMFSCSSSAPEPKVKKLKTEVKEVVSLPNYQLGSVTVKWTAFKHLSKHR